MRLEISPPISIGNWPVKVVGLLTPPLFQNHNELFRFHENLENER